MQRPDLDVLLSLGRAGGRGGALPQQQGRRGLHARRGARLEEHEGIKVADPSSKVYDFYGNPKYTKCLGYEALSLTRSGVTTSFYLTSGVVYGFAITGAGVPICQ